VQHKRIGVWTAGNRSGKSHGGAAEAVSNSIGFRPWEIPDFKPDPNMGYPSRDKIDPKYWLRRADGIPLRMPNRGLVITGLAMDKGIGLICHPKIMEHLPPQIRNHPALKIVKGTRGVPAKVILPNGSEIWYASGRMEAKEFEGGDFDWVWCDEPFPRAFWVPIWRGLTDHFGRIFFTMTAVTDEAPWVKEDLVDTHPHCGHIAGSMYDNPHLTREAQEEMENMRMTEEERNARIHGGWAHLTHRAFPQYDEGTVIVDPFAIPDEWPRTLACDPAHRRPWAFIWIAWGPNDDVYVYDEWPNEPHHLMRSSAMVTQDYVSMIGMKEGTRKADVRVLDPRFGKAKFVTHGEEDIPLVEKFEALGMGWETDVDGTQTENVGIDLIRDMLRYDTRFPCGELNHPRLRVFRPCINTIAMLENSIWVPPNARDPQVLPEQARETYKDFRDALRYGLLYGPEVSPARWGNKRGYISHNMLEEHNYEDF
jgi:hypothetical protein